LLRGEGKRGPTVQRPFVNFGKRMRFVEGKKRAGGNNQSQFFLHLLQIKGKGIHTLSRPVPNKERRMVKVNALSYKLFCGRERD